MCKVAYLLNIHHISFAVVRGWKQPGQLTCQLLSLLQDVLPMWSLAEALAAGGDSSKLAYFRQLFVTSSG
jgi:hypothetical protein